MIIENLTTLKINQLTQAQYEAALAAGTVNENELYATPDNNELDTTTFLRVSDVGSAVDTNPINADTLGGKSASEFLTAVDKTELNNSINTNKIPTLLNGFFICILFYPIRKAGETP